MGFSRFPSVNSFLTLPRGKMFFTFPVEKWFFHIFFSIFLNPDFEIIQPLQRPYLNWKRHFFVVVFLKIFKNRPKFWGKFWNSHLQRPNQTFLLSAVPEIYPRMMFSTSIQKFPPSTAPKNSDSWFCGFWKKNNKYWFIHDRMGVGFIGYELKVESKKVFLFIS